MSGVLAGAGLLTASGAAAVAILSGPSRTRSAAMLVALALFPALIAADQWSSPEISDLRDNPARLAALSLAAAAAIAAMAFAFRRHPTLMPLAIVAAIPFRIPLEAGGEEANLLVPLYLVIAAGVIAPTLRDRSHRGALDSGGGPDSVTGPVGGVVGGPAVWLPRLLAAFVVLYALQTLYSEDFSQGLQNVCFFFVPFAVAFALLRHVRWDRRLLVATLAVVVAEATLFALVGFVEYATRELLWNGAVIRSNDFHVYFRVNSLFWDPNVYGRYLALVIVAVAAALLWSPGRRTGLALTAVATVLWLGLVTTFSQSSFAALLAGLTVLAALRWSLRWTAIACAALAIGGAAFAIAAGSSLRIDFSTANTVNKDTGGRASLVSGGAELFADRPLAGYGSGSFSRAYRRHVADSKARVSESHTEPITIAAEQGIVGIAVYLALLAAALWTMTSGMRLTMPGLRLPLGRSVDPRATTSASAATGPAALAPVIARAAILAMLVALIVHSMAYAGFFEDPLSWALMAVGLSLCR